MAEKTMLSSDYRVRAVSRALKLALASTSVDEIAEVVGLEPSEVTSLAEARDLIDLHYLFAANLGFSQEDLKNEGKIVTAINRRLTDRVLLRHELLGDKQVSRTLRTMFVVDDRVASASEIEDGLVKALGSLQRGMDI